MKPPPKITVCILARNEARHLERCLRSVCDWAYQIVVLDNESTDRTAEIARKYTECVISVASPAAGMRFDALRNVVLEYATGEWVLFLDADERVPERLPE